MLGKTVAELEQGLGSGELREWIAYHNIEPFGSWINGFYHSQLATLIANIKRPSGKQPFKLSDFMFKTQNQQRQQETSATLDRLHALAKKG